jgi:hypothetical protein
MNNNSNKHKNYHILNLIGYGMSKFNIDFISFFGCTTKTAFYDYCIKCGIADSVGTIKNRQDLFDYFFPESGRRGWWQKGNAYIHRKIHIDSLFGSKNVQEYADIVKLYLQENYAVPNLSVTPKPLVKSQFRKLQETGLEAELFFINNYQRIDFLTGGILEDARLYGDGYDFQITVANDFFLADVKGVRNAKADKNSIRLTENEFNKAIEYQDKYFLAVILNLTEEPTIKMIQNPTQTLSFEKSSFQPKIQTEYRLMSVIC